MNPSSKFPSFARFANWLFSRRILRRLVIITVWVVTIAVLWYGEENWRGRRAWVRYRTELTSRGEPADFQAVVPKPVPDAENFAMTPFLAPLFDFDPGTQHQRDTNALARAWDPCPRFDAAELAFKKGDAAPGDWSRDSRMDLVAWQRAFQDPTNYENIIRTSAGTEGASRVAAANAVLEALRGCDAVIDEFRAASRRPYSRFNIRYEEENGAGILLPHLSVLKHVCQVLRLRACAELAQGQTSPAFDDVTLMLHLMNSIRDEPILISYLVRVSEAQLLLQPIWEGLAERRWSENQIRELQNRLSQVDLLGDCRRALQGEREGLGNSIFEYLRRHNTEGRMIGFSDDPDTYNNSALLIELELRVAPNGWIYHEQVEYNRMSLQYIVSSLDFTARVIKPENCARNREDLDRETEGDPFTLFKRHRLLSRLLLPPVSPMAQKAAQGQTWIDLGLLACALERYHLDNGKYPDSIDSLAPGYIERLPHDVITGQPFHYRVLPDNRFALYSVGWNNRDDGGVYPPLPTKEERLRSANQPPPPEGDWVWKYPP